MKSSDVEAIIESARVQGMEWAMVRLIEALTFALAEPDVSAEEVWDRYFEPPVFPLGVSYETERLVRTAITVFRMGVLVSES